MQSQASSGPLPSILSIHSLIQMPKEFNYYQDLRKLKKNIFFSGKPEYWKIRQIEEAGLKKVDDKIDRQVDKQMKDFPPIA